MVEWFKHDVYTQTDLKIKRLIKKAGYEGYGVFWHVTEILYVHGGRISRAELLDELDLIDEGDLFSVLVDLELIGVDDNDDVFNSRVEKEISETNSRKERFSNMGKKSAELRFNTSLTQVEQKLDASSTDKKREEKNIYPPSVSKETSSPKGGKGGVYDNLIQRYNEICKSLPKVKDITDTRKDKLRCLLKSHTEEQIVEAYQMVEDSDFLTGRSGKWSSCNFDWIVKPGNFQKIIEGTYSKESKGRRMMTTDIEKRSRYVNEDGSLNLLGN